MTQRTRFDVIVVVPLREEFEATAKHFQVQQDLSSGEILRVAASLAGSNLSILLVQQRTMGKTAALEATQSALETFDAGLIVCIGIAGGLSSDVNIGDVVCSEGIIDVLDNAKADGANIALSPTFYAPPRELLTLLQLQRLLPTNKVTFETWQEQQFEAGYEMLPGTFIGKDQKNETLAVPDVRLGTIACAMVSASPKYNKKIRAIDRRVLAIETESGGVFFAAGKTPCITVRGICDYAGIDKKKFEEQTNGKAREIAANNAASFLAFILRNTKTQAWIKNAAQTGLFDANQDAAHPSIEKLLSKRATEIDERLSELAPAYSLQAKGYRLPLPRLKLAERAVGFPEDNWSDPTDLRDALRTNRSILLSIPKEYPDNALSWIIASDLLTADIGGKQVMPVVIDAGTLHRPDKGLAKNSDAAALYYANLGDVHLAFVIDAFEFRNRRHSEFLAKEIGSFPNASAIIITRDKSQLLNQSEFLQESGAITARVCDVAFIEISYFLQKNFEMRASEAEVIAVRLRDTFDQFDLPAHPTFFAGIPRETLSALLQANRRGELIQLAVAGYLSFVVAGDPEPTKLSRTTRERFLTELAYDINVQKRSFDEAELSSYVQDISTRFDFAISPTRFVTSFVDAGVLHFDGNQVRFTLPFMEAYLLAKRLHETPDEAVKYFCLGTGGYNQAALALYCELGPTPAFVQQVVEAIDGVSRRLTPTEGGHILITNTPAPRILDRPDRMRALKKQVESATLSVREDEDASRRKQNLLDAYDKIRGSATRKTDEANTPEGRGLGQDAMEAWNVALTLLGSGAERLDAATKRNLIRRIISLASLITDDWTRFQTAIDFAQLKTEMLNDAELQTLLAPHVGDDFTSDAAEKAISGLVDVIEYVQLATPFATIISSLCEEARERVLAESLANTNFNEPVEQLFHAAWLCDVDVGRGKGALSDAVKSLPQSKFLRGMIAYHLLDRVFWNHWQKDDRLALLNIAEQTLAQVRPLSDKGRLLRIIESKNEEEDEA